MVKAKAKSNRVTKYMREQQHITLFVWEFFIQRTCHHFKLEETKDQESLHNIYHRNEVNEDENFEPSRIVDIKEETCNMNIKKLVAIFLQEAGFRLVNQNSIHLIQNKLSKLNLDQDSESISFFLLMNLINHIIDMYENNED